MDHKNCSSLSVEITKNEMKSLFNFKLNIFLLKKVKRKFEKLSLIDCIKKNYFGCY
jgi:hypothetical protein